MDGTDIDRLTRVPLREWKHEAASDFSAWLPEELAVLNRLERSDRDYLGEVTKKAKLYK
jgi:hypothetical protein